MTAKERADLIKFCVSAEAELNGVSEEEVDHSDFEKMTDEELDKESDWLWELLLK